MTETEKSHFFNRALLIEDEEAHEMLILRALKPLVGEVISARTLKEASKIAKEQAIEIVISDLNLPDAVSPTAVEVIRGLNRDIPLIVLTSSTAVADGVAAMKLGADDYISKNFDPVFKNILEGSISRVHAAWQVKLERLKWQRETVMLRAAIERGIDAFAITDETGKVEYINAAFSGLNRDAVPGSIISLSSIDPSGELDKTIISQIQTLEEGGSWTSEINLTTDQNLAYEISVSVLFQAEGGAKRCAIWIRDASERRQREQSQRDLLSTTTHDLKGPLGAVSLSCELLLDGNEINDKTRQVVQRIASSTLTATQLIDELLSARRIEEGGYILKPVTKDLKKLVQDAAESFNVSAAAKKIEFIIELPEGEIQAKVDPLAFQRIISNLVSNAIKFTPRDGKVTLRLMDEGAYARICVQDSGSGIEPSEIPGLFRRFVRTARHSGTAGTGLGLFIVKSITSAHGGNVSVKSSVGRGTSFEVTLPKEPPVNEHGELLCLDFG